MGHTVLGGGASPQLREARRFDNSVTKLRGRRMYAQTQASTYIPTLGR